MEVDEPLAAQPALAFGDLNMAESSLFAPLSCQGTQPAFGITDAALDLGESLLFAPTAAQASQIGSDGAQGSRVGPKEVTLFNGTTVTLRPRIKKNIDLDVHDEEMSIMDINALFKRAEDIKAFKENQRQLDAAADHGARQRDNAQQKSNTIWSEKYRPKRYVELCSAGNDKQYRHISHWLKKWSSVVFKEDAATENVDTMGRPLRKFLLVHGPPGIGKTTAVHLIARQLGYSIQELNASNSMDTLPQVSNQVGTAHSNASAALKLKIQNALTTNTISSQGRPTCLIIDEVDTAINSTEIIKVLSELQSADQRTLTKAATQGSFEKSKNKKKDFLLTRPIICIANDIYNTNMRSFSSFNMDKLRAMAEIVPFRRPTLFKRASGAKTGGKALSSIKDYLMSISEKERLGLDYQKIMEIVEVCEGDIRASINNLQFNGRKIDATADSAASSGKDMQISWFNMADMLFKREAALSREEDFDRLLQTIMNGGGKSATSSAGTLDKVVKACFHKYLDVVYYQDDSLAKPAELCDWLDFYDRLGGNNGISQYASLVNMKIWSLFSEIHPKKSESLLPDARGLEIRSNEAKRKNKGVIKTLLQTMPSKMKLVIGGGFEDNEVIPLYLAAYLNGIMFPGLGSSSQPKMKSSLGDFDKKCLEKSAALVKAFNVGLESYRDMETNQISLEISPDLDSIITYDCELAPSSYSTVCKQVQAKRKWLFPLLQAEMDRMLMASSSKKRMPSPPETEDNANPTKRSKATSSVDFFKGQYAGITTQIAAGAKPKASSSRVWVKFNEGFSNAVRRNIGWNDLWIP